METDENNPLSSSKLVIGSGFMTAVVWSCFPAKFNGGAVEVERELRCLMNWERRFWRSSSFEEREEETLEKAINIKWLVVGGWGCIAESICLLSHLHPVS